MFPNQQNQGGRGGNGASSNPNQPIANAAADNEDPPSYATTINAAPAPPPYNAVDNSRISYSAMQPFSNPDLSPQEGLQANRDPVTLTDAEINAITEIRLLDWYIEKIRSAVLGIRQPTMEEAAVLAKLSEQKRRVLNPAAAMANWQREMERQRAQRQG